MDAIELKKQVDLKISDIATTIASFFAEKYHDEIIAKIKNADFYFYDSYNQVRRLEEIDLKEIAMQFSKDILLEMPLKDDRKNELMGKISEMIIDLSNNHIDYNYLENELGNIPEFKGDINDYLNKFRLVVEYFNNDYEIRKVKSWLSENSNFSSLDISTKNEMLSKHFNLNLEFTETSLTWKLFLSFQKSNYQDRQINYNKHVDKAKFYLRIGCKGNNLLELENDAKNRGLFIDEEKFNACYNDYLNEFTKLAKIYAYKDSNIETILSDLKEKGYHDVDVDDMCRYLIQTEKYRAISFNTNEDDPPFIIYTNNLYVYSSKFNDTFIHEMIHYLGGKASGKAGLMYYQENVDYVHLEEAYTNYLSRIISEKYQENYGVLIDSSVEDDFVNVYDSSLEYMKVVFDSYKEELECIHLGKMSLNEAKKICPIDLINKGIYRIINTNDEAKSKVLAEEINKLKAKKKR